MASHRLSEAVEAQVTAIRDSDMFGFFVETGCGCPVANALYAVSGASKTILSSFQPYDKILAEKMFNNHGLRAVSLANVVTILNAVQMSPAVVDDSRVNTYYVASFQIGDVYSKVRTHGWIGIRYKEITRAFHLSVYDPSYDRQDLIQIIGETGLTLLHYALQETPEYALKASVRLSGLNVLLDMVVTQPSMASIMAGNECDHSSTADTLRFLLDRSDASAYVVISPKGVPVRMDQWCRDREDIVLYKGSFNPPTVEHIRLFKEAMKQNARPHGDQEEPNVCGAFMLSIDTVDKGRISLDELVKRIRYITSLGAYCVINTCGRFSSVISFFQQAYPSANLHFPVGQDTWDRIEEQLRIAHGSHFIVSPRTPCSSTEVRRLLAIEPTQRTSKEVTQLNALVPSVVLAHLAR